MWPNWLFNRTSTRYAACRLLTRALAFFERYSAMARILQIASRILVAMALLAMATALAWPATHSAFMNGGLAMLISAFLSSIWRLCVLRSPIQGRGGALVTINSNPFAYYVGFATLTALCGFLIYVLLKSIW